jgi:hypothetical protein
MVNNVHQASAGATLCGNKRGYRMGTLNLTIHNHTGNQCRRVSVNSIPTEYTVEPGEHDWCIRYNGSTVAESSYTDVKKKIIDHLKTITH